MTIDQYYERTPVTVSELDVAGELIGFKILEQEAQRALVGVYVEDDGWWHLKIKLDSSWLHDLLATTSRTIHLLNPES